MSTFPGARTVASAATLALTLAVALVALVVPAAHAAPPTRGFDATIDALARYDGQWRCDPTEKPGVVGFRTLVQQTYSGVNSGGISRDCTVGGVSEHKEGRAWDWMLRADRPEDVAKADDLLTWLLATDAHGNKHAMARRLGVMYIIWNRKVWESYAPDDGWTDYTGSNPHTDHIHFSFSWDGALERTSWWNGGVPSTEPSPSPSPTPETDPTPTPDDTPTDEEPTGGSSPLGDLEQVSAEPGAEGAVLRASGYAVDPDAATFTTVVLAVDGTEAGRVVANAAHETLQEKYPQYTKYHGFSTTVPAQPGSRTVCATAVDQGEGSDVELGCVTVTVPEATTPAPEPTTPSGAPRGRPTDDSCPTGAVPSAGFADTVGSVHADAVDCAVWWEIGNGVADDRYAPEAVVTRAQLATFLAKLLTSSGATLPAEAPDAFDDDAGVHEDAINTLAAAGVVAGKGDGRYDAQGVVSRAQMAAYLVRTYEYRTGLTLPAGADWFVDDDGSVHAAAISKAARVGFTAGTSDTTFEPTAELRRGQVASFAMRVLDLLVESGWTPPRD
jgi:hypothetical protein